jgi:integrase
MVTRKSKLKPIRNADGSISYVPQVRLKGFKPVSRSFCSADYETATAAHAAAVRWRDELTAELQKQRQEGAPRPDITTLTLGDLTREYLADPVTQGLRYQKELERNLEWWKLNYGTTKALEFGVVQLREARSRLMPGRQPATVVRILASMRSCWNWSRAAGLLPKDKVWPPRLMLREPDARTRYLSDAELAALLKAAKASSAVLFAAIVVSIACGMRKGELLRLEWNDIDFDRSRVQLLITKNGSARSVHLPAMAAAALKDLKAAPVVSATHAFLAPNGKPLSWQTLDKMWRVVRTAARLQDFRWHDLRHSCASILAQSGASLLEIGSVLGHRSANVTLKYSHLVQGAPVTGHAALNEKLGGKPS